MLTVSAKPRPHELTVIRLHGLVCNIESHRKCYFSHVMAHEIRQILVPPKIQTQSALRTSSDFGFQIEG